MGIIERGQNSIAVRGPSALWRSVVKKHMSLAGTWVTRALVFVFLVVSRLGVAGDWQHPGSFLAANWQLSGSFLAAFWQRVGNMLAAFWQQIGSFLATNWQQARREIDCVLSAIDRKAPWMRWIDAGGEARSRPRRLGGSPGRVRYSQWQRAGTN
jgi:hypothetical protein